MWLEERKDELAKTSREPEKTEERRRQSAAVLALHPPERLRRRGPRGEENRDPFRAEQAEDPRADAKSHSCNWPLCKFSRIRRYAHLIEFKYTRFLEEISTIHDGLIVNGMAHLGANSRELCRRTRGLKSQHRGVVVAIPLVLVEFVTELETLVGTAAACTSATNCARGIPSAFTGSHASACG